MGSVQIFFGHELLLRWPGPAELWDSHGYPKVLSRRFFETFSFCSTAVVPVFSCGRCGQILRRLDVTSIAIAPTTQTVDGSGTEIGSVTSRPDVPSVNDAKKATCPRSLKKSRELSNALTLPSTKLRKLIFSKVCGCGIFADIHQITDGGDLSQTTQRIKNENARIIQKTSTGRKSSLKSDLPTTIYA